MWPTAVLLLLLLLLLSVCMHTCCSNLHVSWCWLLQLRQWHDLTVRPPAGIVRVAWRTVCVILMGRHNPVLKLKLNFPQATLL
jgi:hypothetical protein